MTDAHASVNEEGSDDTLSDDGFGVDLYSDEIRHPDRDIFRSDLDLELPGQLQSQAASDSPK